MIHPGPSKDAVFKIRDDPAINSWPCSHAIWVSTGLWSSEYFGSKLVFQIDPGVLFSLSRHYCFLQCCAENQNQDHWGARMSWTSSLLQLMRFLVGLVACSASVPPSPS